MNANLAPDIDTVFLAASDQYAHISSRLVKEVASYGVPVDNLVPPLIASRLTAHLAARKGGHS